MSLWPIKKTGKGGFVSILLKVCDTSFSVASLEVHSAFSYWEKNQDTAKCFQNYLSQSGELRHKEQAANNTSFEVGEEKKK